MYLTMLYIVNGKVCIKYTKNLIKCTTCKFVFRSKRFANMHIHSFVYNNRHTFNSKLPKFPKKITKSEFSENMLIYALRPK